MIEFQHVSKTLGGQRVIDDLSLRIAPGEFAVLMGPSGAGKSTTLRLINRLIEHDQGQILFAGEPSTRVSPEALRRRMGYAIQSTGLFPHWTVAQNIATVPQLLKWKPARIQARVSEMLALLELDETQFRQRYPHQLSGGQQQRVGVARALAADPEVLLMDEPFGALDPVTRKLMQAELARIHRVTGKTIVMVTHDLDEALRLASRIYLLDQGRLLQSGTPLEIVTRPASAVVADFVGTADAGLHLLGLRHVAEVMQLGETADGAPIAQSATLREALSCMVQRGVQQLAVADAQGSVVGTVAWTDLLRPKP